MKRPLHGVRILDLTRLLPGAYCTLRLAGLGADVIKIEEPGRGDYMRDLGLGELFTLVNRGKRSVALDLKAEAGRAALLRLAEAADVLVESFRPGTLARLAGDPRAANPHLIVCSLSGYGPDGPYRDWPGHDVNYLSVAGYLGLQRRPDEDPVLPPTPLADVLGGMEAAMAITAALLAPVRGAAIELSLFEAARSVMLLPWSRARLRIRAAAASPAPRRATASTGARTAATWGLAPSSHSSGRRSALASAGRTSCPCASRSRPPSRLRSAPSLRRSPWPTGPRPCRPRPV